MGESDIDQGVAQGTPARVTPTMTATPNTLRMESNPGNRKLKIRSRPPVQSHKKIIRKGTSPYKDLARWLLDNQIGFSFNLIGLIFLTHLCMSKARPYTSKLFLTSHYNPNTGNYAAGGDDFYFLGFCIVLFTGLRAVFMDYILAPIAKQWGLSKKKDVTRFSEQAWLLCYYSVFWTLGVYIYCTSKYFLNPREMFTDWPTRELSGIRKAYILCQWAFWLQQVIVINIEERRKDHWQMLAHHIVTIVLISTSYAFHLTRVANLVLVLMDVVDIFFPLAKCLKYLGFSTLRDFMFGAFMLSWFLARHVFYMVTMWSIWTHMGQIIPVGCYHGSQDNLTGPTPLPDHGWSHMLDPFRNPSGTICYSDNVQRGFLIALGFLQVLTVFWFFLIIKVALRVIKGMGADDIRSDDDGGDEEDLEYKGIEPPEVGVESIGLKGWKRGTGTKRATSSSGVSLPGHRDRKELLSRIGCEKQVD